MCFSGSDLSRAQALCVVLLGVSCTSILLPPLVQGEGMLELALKVTWDLSSSGLWQE